MWLPHPVYRLSTNESGEVMSHNGTIRKVRRDREGYARINFWHGGALLTRKVATIVAECWLGEQPFPGAEVCHGKAGQFCDKPNNLRWGTHQENLADRKTDGRLRPHKRLSQTEIRAIRDLLAVGVPKIAIARQFATSPSNVRDIARRPQDVVAANGYPQRNLHARQQPIDITRKPTGRNAHYAPNVAKVGRPRDRKREAEAWRLRYEERMPMAQIVEALGVHRATVSRWLSGK